MYNPLAPVPITASTTADHSYSVVPMDSVAPHITQESHMGTVNQFFVLLSLSDQLCKELKLYTCMYSVAVYCLTNQNAYLPYTMDMGSPV